MNIEFEITLRCNAKCPSCSRHSHYGLYGVESDVTMEQVDRFIEEVKRHGNIDMISIMGGEPTVHPEFRSIAVELQNKLLNEGFIKRLQIVTNGSNPIQFDTFLLYNRVGVCIARPEDKADKHRCMFVAPCDTGQELKECKVPYDCGVSFGAFGWWPCGAGGAICRLFGLNKYNKESIPIHEDDFPDKTKMCVLCQAKAKQYLWCKDYGEMKSASFRDAFRNFDVNRLWRY